MWCFLFIVDFFHVYEEDYSMECSEVHGVVAFVSILTTFVASHPEYECCFERPYACV